MSTTGTSNTVSVGLASIAGYGLALASLVTPVVAALAGYTSAMHVPNWAYVAISATLVSIVTWGRQYQAGQANQGTPAVIPAPVGPTPAQSAVIDPAFVAQVQALAATLPAATTTPGAIS